MSMDRLGFDSKRGRDFGRRLACPDGIGDEKAAIPLVFSGRDQRSPDTLLGYAQQPGRFTN